MSNIAEISTPAAVLARFSSIVDEGRNARDRENKAREADWLAMHATLILICKVRTANATVKAQSSFN